MPSAHEMYDQAWSVLLAALHPRSRHFVRIGDFRAVAFGTLGRFGKGPLHMADLAADFLVVIVQRDARGGMVEFAFRKVRMAAVAIRIGLGKVIRITVTGLALQLGVLLAQRKSRAIMRESHRFALLMALVATHLRMAGIARGVERLLTLGDLCRRPLLAVATAATFSVMAGRAINAVLFGVVLVMKGHHRAAAVGRLPDFFLRLLHLVQVAGHVLIPRSCRHIGRGERAGHAPLDVAHLAIGFAAPLLMTLHTLTVVRPAQTGLPHVFGSCQAVTLLAGFNLAAFSKVMAVGAFAAHRGHLRMGAVIEGHWLVLVLQFIEQHGGRRVLNVL